jgi:dienelactone hydrolase
MSGQRLKRARGPWSFRALGASALALTFLVTPRLAAGVGFDQQDFSGSANPWSGAFTYAYQGTGTATASHAWGDFGAPATPSGTATPGIRLTAQSNNSGGHWGAALASGRIATPSLVGVPPERIALSLRLRTSEPRGVLLKLESYDSSGVSTGVAQTTLHASAAGTWQLHHLVLDSLVNKSGAFSPASPSLQLTLEIGSSSNTGNWPKGNDRTLDLDDVNIAVLPANTGFSRMDFSGSANPWPNTSRYTYAGTGSVIASATWGLHGVSANGTPTAGLRLDADASTVVNSWWGAALTSGLLAPPSLPTNDLALLNLNFSLLTSSALPVRVRLESFNASGTRTGRADATAHQPAAHTWHRHSLDLSAFTVVEGDFDPAAHRLQLILEIGSGTATGGWPAAAGHSLQLDDVHLSGPVYHADAPASPSTIVNDWETWRGARFSPAQISATGTTGPLDDPDADGLNNLFEYALGLDPRSPASGTAGPAVTLTPSLPHSLSLTFPRHRADLAYEVQASSDLTNWQLLARDPGQLGRAVTVTDTPPAGANARFLRLQIVARANQSVTKDFPDVPIRLAELAGLAKPAGEPTRATLSFPNDYRADRTYPLAVLINGSEGRNGDNIDFGRSVVGNNGWFVLAVPSWKASVEPLNSNNYWDRIYIRNSDAATIWAGLRPMLEWADTLAPNIDRSRSVIGGFSNGAHTAAALFTNAQISAALAPRFGRIVLVDGGNTLYPPANSLIGKKILLLQGNLGRNSDLFQYIRNPVKFDEDLDKAGLEITDHVMVGVGHAFPDSAKTTVREWLALP